MSILAALLSENGLPDLPVSLIEPHRDHGPRSTRSPGLAMPKILIVRCVLVKLACAKPARFIT